MGGLDVDLVVGRIRAAIGEHSEHLVGVERTEVGVDDPAVGAVTQMLLVVDLRAGPVPGGRLDDRQQQIRALNLHVGR